MSWTGSGNKGDDSNNNNPSRRRGNNNNGGGGTSGVGEPLVSRNRHPPTREQKIQEMEIIQDIMKLIRHKIDTSPTIREMADRNLSSENTEYAAERQVLMQVNNIGLREGVIAGLATFITLRKAPGIIARYVARRSARQYPSGGSGSGSTYKLDSPNPFQANQTERGGPSSSSSSSSLGMVFLRAVRFTLDVIVSLTVGASTSFYFTDQDYMLSQIANVPLVEGRSLVSDEFCTDMIHQFNKVPPEVWRDTQNPALISVRTFVKNCQYRQSYEEKLRHDYQLQPKEPVSIPAPGVDTSYMMMNPNNNKNNNNSSASHYDTANGEDASSSPLIGEDPFASSTNNTNNQEYFGEDEQQLEGGGDNTKWAESLVTDQEEENSRQQKNDNVGGKEKKKRWW